MQKGQSETKRKRREQTKRKPDHVKICSSSRLSPRFAICQDIGNSDPDPRNWSKNEIPRRCEKAATKPASHLSEKDSVTFVRRQ
jgi:hypothetical protein